MTVIGVVGQAGSGKSELTRYLRKKARAKTVSTAEIARNRKPGKDREALIEAYNDAIKNESEDYFARRAIERMPGDPGAVCALDSVLTPADVRRLRKQFGDDFILVHVDVIIPQARVERLVRRNDPGDPDNMDQLLKQDEREDKLFDLSETISMADVTVNNDGTMKAFHSNIETELLESDVLRQK